MITVDCYKNDYIVTCDGCGCEINPGKKSWLIGLGVELMEPDRAEEYISLCENCRNHLSNEL